MTKHILHEVGDKVKILTGKYTGHPAIVAETKIDSWGFVSHRVTSNGGADIWAPYRLTHDSDNLYRLTEEEYLSLCRELFYIKN